MGGGGGAGGGGGGGFGDSGAHSVHVSTDIFILAPEIQIDRCATNVPLKRVNVFLTLHGALDFQNFWHYRTTTLLFRTSLGSVEPTRLC